MKIKVIKFLIIVLILNIFVPPVSHYLSNYSGDNYMLLDENLGYHDIFYVPSSDWWKMYGIGASDVNTSDYLIDNPSSDLKKYYDRHNIFAYPASTMTDLTFLLEECTFKSVDKNKAFILSLLFNYHNNVTTVNLSASILSEQLRLKNEPPKKPEDVFGEIDLSNGGIELDSDDIHIIHAGVYTLSDKTYLVADYAVPGIVIGEFLAEKNIDLEEFETQIAMFEIIDSDAENEIVERRYGFKTARFDCYDSSPYGLINIILPVLIVMLYIILTIRKGKIV